MNLERGKISNLQLFFTMLVYVLAFNLYTADAESITKQYSWIAEIIGLLEGAFIIYIYTTLALKFPGKTIIEINDIIYGRYFGKVISVMYMWFFLSTVIAVQQYFGSFSSTSIFQETPLIVFIVMIVGICAYGVRTGIETICRTTFLIAAVVYIEIIVSIILQIKDMDFEYLFPIMGMPIKDVIKGGHILGVYYGESICFLMILPFVNKINKITKRNMFFSMLLGAIFIIAVLLRNILVLGNLNSIYNYPAYSAIRLINVGQVFTRLEILLYIELITVIFIQISILYYALTLSTAQILKLKSYKPLIIPIGVIIISLYMLDSKISLMEISNFYLSIYYIYAIPFEIIIPLVSLIIVLIKERRGINKIGSSN